MKNKHSNEDKSTIFVSFNSKFSGFVDSLEKRISSKAEVIRYEDHVSAWGSFRDFMDTISEQQFAVLVISEDYLKSDACMYEVCQLMQDESWIQKTMFAVMPDAGLYNAEKRIDYIRYWNEKYTSFEEKLRGLRPESIKVQIVELERMKQVSDTIGTFLDVVSDSKNPPLYDVIEEIYKRVEMQRRPVLKMSVQNNETISLGHWYVLEFLKKNGAVPARKIAEASGLSHSYVHRVLRNYLEHGIIMSTEQRFDNRLINVYSPVEDDTSA